MHELEHASRVIVQHPALSLALLQNSEHGLTAAYEEHVSAA